MTKKLMTMRKDLHSKDDIDRLYMSRKEGKIVFVITVDRVDTTIQRLELFIMKEGERKINFQQLEIV